MVLNLGNVGRQLNEASKRLPSVQKELNSRLPSIVGTNVPARNINGLPREVGQTIQNVTGQLGNFQNQVNSALRQFNNVGSNITGIPNLGSSFFNVNNSLNAGVAKLQSQIGQISTGINRVTGAVNLLNDLSQNPNKIGQIITNKISGLVNANLAPALGAIGNIAGLGSSLANAISTFNPISVINRGVNFLESAIGGVYAEASSRIRTAGQYSDLLPNLGKQYTDPWAEYAGFGGQSPGLGTGNTARHRNKLRDFNHYNYIITFGVLSSSELNFPNLLRNAGSFNTIIFRSGGGAYDKRTRIAVEGNEDAEYFIENLEITAVVAPNAKTGFTIGTSVTFEVIEPLSMGNFIEAIIVGSDENGYANYIDTPYCLQVEFVGWDEYGVKPIYPYPKPLFFPIKITKMDFDVTERGSVYRIEAITFEGIANFTQIQEAKTDISVSGDSVFTILQAGRDSVTNAFNNRIENLEEKKLIENYDRYIIAFPSEPNGIIDALESQNIFGGNIPAAVQDARRRGIEEGATQFNDPDQERVEIPVTRSSNSQIYDILKSYAEDPKKMNPIGTSTIVEDTREGSDHSHPETAGVYEDAILRGLRRNAATLAPSEKARVQNFPQGTKIEKIIESVLLSSEYLKNSASTDNGTGFKPWFRIETYTFIDDTPFSSTEQQMGRPRRIYVYAVHPYSINEALTNGPTQRPRNVQSLKNSAAKEYNYYYTGENEDILDFNINFNLAFFNNNLADFGQPRVGVSSDVASTGDNSVIETPKQNAPQRSINNLEASPIVGQETSLLGLNAGFRRSITADAKRNIAVQLHERILNSQADMIRAELTIWGDPYYMPTVLGNYSSPPAGVNTSADNTMLYLRDQAYIIINFKTPFDYELDGTIKIQQIKSFSGLFQVLSVLNIFSEGVFKQVLDLSRITGQNDPATTDNRGFVQEGSDQQSALVPKTVPASQIGYGEGQIDPRLARAAGIVSAPIGFGPGQVDPALARAVVANANGGATDPRVGIFGNSSPVGLPTSNSNVGTVPQGAPLSQIVKAQRFAASTVSSARIPGQNNVVRPGYETNALDVLEATNRLSQNRPVSSRPPTNFRPQ